MHEKIMRWLLKTDPQDYTYYDLERDGRAVWDGVSNNLALQNLRKIKRGDAILIYHTGAEKAVVGLAEAASDPYTDPKATDQKLVVIDVKPRRRAKRPATLEEIKRTKALASFQLVRLPRLSVVPVSEQEWSTLAEMTGL
jgi:predicted RNA-binding protein with PUA-like domain